MTHLGASARRRGAAGSGGARDGLLVDGEGVVFDTEPMWDIVQRDFLARRGIRYDRALLKPRLTGRSLREGTEVLRSLYALGDDPEELTQERLEMFEDLLSRGVSFIPGYPEFHARMASRYRLCLATSMPQRLLGLVDNHLGLRELFEGAVVTVDDVGGRGKPAPDIFLAAAARIEVEPSRCLVVEDAPAGVEAARRAGMRVIGLATTHDPPVLGEADLVVSTLEQIDVERLETLALCGAPLG